ncbi:MAG TPA: hypothetical protein VGD59_01685 [Acidisarcina sp.]
MARGWESKSVEDQVAEHEIHLAKAPALHKAREDSARKREIQSLQLQRERILSERTSSPLRRAALGAALSEVESKLKALDVKLGED